MGRRPNLEEGSSAKSAVVVPTRLRAEIARGISEPRKLGARGAMASWNLESVGTKGLGGGGGYICGKVARSWIQKKKTDQRANYDGVGIFQDPLMDSVYGQCTSSTRAGVPRPEGIEELLKPTDLELALAEARASAVVFGEAFTSRRGRKVKASPLACLGGGEHTMFVIKPPRPRPPSSDAVSALVLYNGRGWSVERRFSEFDELDKELAPLPARDGPEELARLPACDGPEVHLPPFPSKVWVGKVAQETQDRRKVELEAYIQALVRQPAFLQSSPHIRVFLEIPPRVPLDPAPPRDTDPAPPRPPSSSAAAGRPPPPSSSSSTPGRAPSGLGGRGGTSGGGLGPAAGRGEGGASLDNPYARRGGGGAAGAGLNLSAAHATSTAGVGRGGAEGVRVEVKAAWEDPEDDEVSL
ncbi:hypothetical protein T484DRAFT_1787686 [Baffinella frigidus]|nr:hypothetical protein T484DRAFT_1787686 [Cryptophyta sp. CCMP2293]